MSSPCCSLAGGRSVCVVVEALEVERDASTRVMLNHSTATVVHVRQARLAILPPPSATSGSVTVARFAYLSLEHKVLPTRYR